MNKANRNYTNEQIDLLSGKIQGSKYLEEVQGQLAKMGKSYSDGYVHRVVAQFSYNNDIWDAVNSVLNTRQEKKNERIAQLEQLV